jgi:RNA polymerase sporulation-specific sigma factor
MQSCEKYSGNRELIKLAQGEEEAVAEKATESLININIGLVRSIAVRFKDRGVDLEDLIQIGIIGMIKAIRSFELERETTFSTYAVPLIIGEIRRHLRDDGLIKISRYHKKLGMELMNARNKIIGDDGREPGIEELAELCGVSVEDAAVALDATSPVMSLSSSCGAEDNGMTLESRIADTDNEIEKMIDHLALSQAISKMPPVWRRIVVLRYYKNYTQQETADTLGLSQVKVSREEKKIMAFLKDELVG